MPVNRLELQVPYQLLPAVLARAYNGNKNCNIGDKGAIMKARTALFGAWILAAAPLAHGYAQNAPAAAPITAIKAGQLVDVVTGQVKRDQIILVENGRISAVGAMLAIPAGAVVIDLSAMTVMPGFIDTHTHITSDAYGSSYSGYSISTPREALTGLANAQKMLLAGFTTLRNVGAGGFSDLAVRDAINDGQFLGPRILAGGPSLGITGGHCDSNLLAPEYKERGDGVADGVDGVRIAVRRNVKYGVDVIKYCGTGGVFSKGTQVGAQQYTEEEVKALIDEAHMHGRKVAVHAHGASGIKVALRNGVDTVEHASLIDDEGIALAKKTGAYLSMDIYNTEFTQEYGRKIGTLEEFLKKDASIAQVQRDNFRKAVKAGVKMTYGTDAGVFPHEDAGKHFKIMVDYGMTPMQAIQAATINGAGALGVLADTGTIEAGKSADIIAVNTDPLTDRLAMESVDFVMMKGQVAKQ